MKQLLVAIICVFFLSQCSKKIYSLDNLPKQYIELGSFGGIAGVSHTYFLLPNGQQFMRQAVMGSSSPENTKEIESIEPKAFKEICKDLKEMNFMDMELNEKGNMNYFISYKTKKKENRVQWSNSATAPQGLVSLYKNVLKNINKAAIN